jgi:hypothetical protein
MVEVLVMLTESADRLNKDGCGYNLIYRHQWRTHTNALPMHIISLIHKITEDRKWGWTFSPHKNMDYNSPNWYENQTLILTFEDQSDLVQTKLEVSHLL